MCRCFVIAVFIHLAVLYNTADFTDELNITIDSSPKLGYGTVCVNESVNLTCLTDQKVEIITWYWLDQSKEGSHITVQATLSDVVYTCKASDNNGQLGEANITVGANGCSGDKQFEQPLLSPVEEIPVTAAQQEVYHPTTTDYGATGQSPAFESDQNQASTSSRTGKNTTLKTNTSEDHNLPGDESQISKPDESVKTKPSGSKYTEQVHVHKQYQHNHDSSSGNTIVPTQDDKTTPCNKHNGYKDTQTGHTKQTNSVSNITQDGSSDQKHNETSYSTNSESPHTHGRQMNLSADGPTAGDYGSGALHTSKPDGISKAKPNASAAEAKGPQTLNPGNSAVQSIERSPVEASDGSNYKKISSHAHDQLGGAFPPEFCHYESNTVIVNVYNVPSESVQPKPEQLSLDTTNPLRQHAIEFNQLVNIGILALVLFKNALLTQQDMEYLQLTTITDIKKVDYVHLKMVRLGEEDYKKFLSCLKDPYAMQHDGHIKLHDILSTSQQ